MSPGSHPSFLEVGVMPRPPEVRSCLFPALLSPIPLSLTICPPTLPPNSHLSSPGVPGIVKTMDSRALEMGVPPICPPDPWRVRFAGGHLCRPSGPSNIKGALA